MNGLFASAPLIIGAAAAFLIFCAALSAFEKRGERPEKKL